MSYDPLLTVLGLAALATPVSPAVFAVTADKAAIGIQPGSLPSSGFDVGSLAIDSDDGNTLKWFDGTDWQSAGGGGGLANIASNVTGNTLTIDASLTDASTVTFRDGGGYALLLESPTPVADAPLVWDSTNGVAIASTTLYGFDTLSWTPASLPAEPSLGDTVFDTADNRIKYYDGSAWIIAQQTPCANDFDGGPYDGMLQLSTIAGDFAIAEGLIWDAGQTRLNVPGDVDVSSVMLVPAEGLPGGQAGQIAFDNTDSKLYYHNGSDWLEVGGGSGGLTNIASNVSGGTITFEGALTNDHSVTFPDIGGAVGIVTTGDLGEDRVLMWDSASQSIVGTNYLYNVVEVFYTPVSAPLNELEGVTYYNVDDHVLRFYNGTVWVDCGGGGGLANIASNVTGDTLTIEAALTGPQTVVFSDFSGTAAVVPAADTGNEYPLMWNTAAQAAIPSVTIYNFNSLEFAASPDPGTPNPGHVYFDDVTSILRYYDGSSWIDIIAQAVTSVNGQTGDVSIVPPGASTQVIFNDNDNWGASPYFTTVVGADHGEITLGVDHLTGSSPTVNLDGYSGPGYDLAGRLFFKNNGSNCWALWPNNVATGSDVGYDFRLMAFGDSGVWQEDVLTIARVQGGAAVWSRRNVFGPTGAATPSVSYLNVSPATNKPTTVANGDVWFVAKSMYVRTDGGDIMVGGNDDNTGLGYNVFNSTYTGTRNVAVGSTVMSSLTSGGRNTAVGNECLYTVTTGSHNSALGTYALYYATTAAHNTAIGFEALVDLVEGDGNVAVGESALQDCISAASTGYNVGIGSKAGVGLTTGVNNVFIGAIVGTAGSQLATASNSVAIGYDSFTTKSNQIVLGNDNMTETVIFSSADIIFESTVSLDLGDPTVDGTWRIRRETADLVMERRESDTFVEKFRVEA